MDINFSKAAVNTNDVGGDGVATITTGTSAVTGTFSAITVVNDAVFTSLTPANPLPGVNAGIEGGQ